MRKWEKVELGNRYCIDRDFRQWSLLRRKATPGKDGEYGYVALGYYPTLRSTIQALATRRLGETHIDDWQKVVSEIDAMIERLELKLPDFWRGGATAVARPSAATEV